MKHHARILSLFAVLLFYPFTAFALSTDRDKPINIEADHVDINKQKGTSVYKGKVIIVQGSIHIEGDVATLHRNDKGVEKIIVTGNPTTFRQSPESGQEDIHGKGKRLEYYSSQDRLHLYENAIVWQHQDTFTGDHIDYDTNQHIVRASGKPGDSGQRVHVTIQPKN